MPLNPTVKAALEAQLATKNAQLTAINTAYTEALASGVESYAFDSGEGSQRTRKRSLKDMREAITALENDINELNQRLNGTGIMRIGLRRYG